MKSGFVSLIGRPNVGKSTLLNAIVNDKIAITSSKVQTTRNVIQGIYNDEDSQIIFIDTPGIHKPKNKLGKVLNKKAQGSIHDVDVILFLIDASHELGPGDNFIIQSLKNITTPVILIINKIDLITKEMILLKINEYKDLYNFAEIIPVSAEKKENIDHLISVIKKYLTDDYQYYPEDLTTSSSKLFLISEYVREKVLMCTDEEVPHSVTCLTTHYEEKKEIININVDIIVDRDSLKKIIIGKQGSKLKQIGALARIDIEKMLGKQIYLELYVRTIPRWRDRERHIKELGLKD